MRLQVTYIGVEKGPHSFCSVCNSTRSCVGRLMKISLRLIEGDWIALKEVLICSKCLSLGGIRWVP